MNILAIDTCHSEFSVAILQDGKILKDITCNEPGKHAEKLLVIIEKILHATSLTYNKIDRLAVSIGPGSFTGVRIGLAAVKGINLATKIPIIGITTLEAVAEQSDSIATKLVCLDARRDQIYAQIFSNNFEALSEALLLTYENISQMEPKEPYTIIGDGSDKVIAYLQNKQFNVISHTAKANAASVAKVAFRKAALAIQPVKPLYLRSPVDA